MKYITTIDDKEFEIEVVDERHIRIGDRLLEVDFESVSGQPVFSLILDGKSYRGVCLSRRGRLGSSDTRTAVSSQH